MPTTTNKVFISYSHKDERFLQQLRVHLKPLERSGLVSSWSDKQIQPGSQWFDELKRALACAKVAVLLVTKDFLASDFIQDHELGPLLKDAEIGGVQIRWILIRDCNWKKTRLKDFQAAYPPGKPLAEMRAERDRAWVAICEDIENAANLEERHVQRDASLTNFGLSPQSTTLLTGAYAELKSCVLGNENGVPDLPYSGFDKNFREVIGARRMPESGAVLNIVFGSLAEIRNIPVVIPIGQDFDFLQRGSRSVLASFETIRVGQHEFFDEVERIWPFEQRPKAAGLGHAEYLKLPKNSQDIPGVLFVVTSRNISQRSEHYGLYVNTPIQGIEYVLEGVLASVRTHNLDSIALPLLGAGYANIRRIHNSQEMENLVRMAVAFVSIQRLESFLKDASTGMKRAVLVIFSREHSKEEHQLWETIACFITAKSHEREALLSDALMQIKKLETAP